MLRTGAGVLQTQRRRRTQRPRRQLRIEVGPSAGREQDCFWGSLFRHEPVLLRVKQRAASGGVRGGARRCGGTDRRDRICVMTKSAAVVLTVSAVPFLLGLCVDLVSFRANLLRAGNAVFRKTEKVPSPVPIAGLVLYLMAWLLAREIRPRPGWVDVAVVSALLFHLLAHCLFPDVSACARLFHRHSSRP